MDQIDRMDQNGPN